MRSTAIRGLLRWFNESGSIVVRCRMGRPHRDSRRSRKPLDDAHIVGAKAGRGIVMSHPQSA